MNLFGWFRKSNDARKGRGGPAPAANPHAAPSAPAPLLPDAAASPEEVRRLLFDAVAARDDARLEALCREHKDVIRAEGAGWLEVPDAFRSSPEAYTWYGNGLRAIARFCSDRLGDSELLHNLQLPPQETSRRH